MADFTVDPDGNVKDCRADVPPQPPPVPPLYPPYVHPLFGHVPGFYDPPKPLLERARGLLGLFVCGIAIWLVFGGICWLITGRWPDVDSRGRPPFPVPGWSTVEQPRIPQVVPSISKPPDPSPPMRSPWQQPLPELQENLMTMPSHVERDSRKPFEETGPTSAERRP